MPLIMQSQTPNLNTLEGGKIVITSMCFYYGRNQLTS